MLLRQLVTPSSSAAWLLGVSAYVGKRPALPVLNANLSPGATDRLARSRYQVHWNRIRYTAWAPVYDALAGAVGFAEARRRSIERLYLVPGNRVLLIGAGTGLDLDYLPAGVAITAVDVTPAMLKRLQARAARSDRAVSAHVMDARMLRFADGSFDAIVMHLIVAVMPDPDRGLQEAERVLRPGGRIAVFDKFLRQGERASIGRRLLNLIAKPMFSDMNRCLEPLVATTSLRIEHDEPIAFGGVYRIATLIKPAN